MEVRLPWVAVGTPVVFPTYAFSMQFGSPPIVVLTLLAEAALPHPFPLFKFAYAFGVAFLFASGSTRHSSSLLSVRVTACEQISPTP